MAGKKDSIPISLTQFMTIIALVITVYFIVDFSDKALASYRIRRIEARLIQEIEEEKAERRRLEERLKYVQTDEYVERVAREELRWGKPGETLVIVPTPPQPTPTPQAKSQSR